MRDVLRTITERCSRLLAYQARAARWAASGVTHWWAWRALEVQSPQDGRPET
jgi:hypothetical protein